MMVKLGLLQALSYDSPPENIINGSLHRGKKGNETIFFKITWSQNISLEIISSEAIIYNANGLPDSSFLTNNDHFIISLFRIYILATRITMGKCKDIWVALGKDKLEESGVTGSQRDFFIFYLATRSYITIIRTLVML